MSSQTSKFIITVFVTTLMCASSAQSKTFPTYEQWKQTKIEQWGKDSSFVNNIQELLIQTALINPHLEKMAQQCDMPIRLYAYNFLREITEKNLIHATDEFDETWFNHVANQFSAVTTKELIEQSGVTFADPEPWQTALVKEARKATNINVSSGF